MRIHNGCRHGLAAELKVLGLHVEQEAPVPMWARANPRTGQLEEAILDLEVRVPGSSQLVRVDLACVHTEAQTYRGSRPGPLIEREAQDKITRYGQHVAPLAMALRGRLSSSAIATIRLLAAMASATSGIGPSKLARRLARRVAVAAAVGEARARLGAIGGKFSARLVANRLLVNPAAATSPPVIVLDSDAPAGAAELA